MTLKLLSDNQNILIELATSKSLACKKILNDSSRTLISCIIELILNLNNVSINDDEVELTTSCKELYDYFQTDTIRSLEVVRAFLHTNHYKIRGLVAYMLHKILTEAVLCVQDFDTKGAHSENTCNWISFEQRFFWNDGQE